MREAALNHEAVPAICYTLTLRPEPAWSFSGVGNAAELLARVAPHFGLQSGTTGHVLRHVHLVPRPPGKYWLRVPPSVSSQNSTTHQQGNGWSLVDLGMIRLWRQKNAPNIICEMEAPRNWSEEATVIWHALRTVYEDVYALGGLPLHAALVERNGCGALLVGDSGMGKSTCCKRIVSPWRALADEEVVLLPDGLNRFSCYPFPTLGQLLEPPQSFADLSLQHVPPAAIFFLEQTPRDRIQRIGQGQTALRLKRSTNPIFGFRARSGHQAFQSNAKKLAFTNASAVAQAVPGFMLGVSLTGRFWELMDEVLDHGKRQRPRNDLSGPMIREPEGLMKAHQYNL